MSIRKSHILTKIRDEKYLKKFFTSLSEGNKLIYKQ